VEQKKLIQNFAIAEFLFLETEQSLSKPIIEKNNWFATNIYYLAPEIGFQIQLDWHEFKVFVLVVLLDEGKIPSGYYVHQGRKIRVHLGEVLKKYLNVQDKKLGAKKEKRSKNKQPVDSEKAIKQEIVECADILRKYCKEIINLKGRVFDE